MPSFAEVLETIREEESSVRRTFDQPSPVSEAAAGPWPSGAARITEIAPGERSIRNRRRTPAFMARVLEAARFLNEIYEGRRPLYQLREAMSTSDFPDLFGDILDRLLLAGFRETPQTFRAYTRIATVPDFREVRRLAMDGAEGVLERVAQGEEYPESSLDDSELARYAVTKFGRKLPLLWEVLVNDDLDAFRSIPDRLGRAARRSESKFAVELFVDASGPHASFYTGGNGNIITGNPALSIAALETAFEVLSDQTDADDEPIMIDSVHLVVPPALEVTANNILNALQLEVTASGGTSAQKLIAANWMRNRLTLHVEPYITNVASTANGKTSWFLFGSPADSRPALEMGFLRGHTEPELFIKDSNQRRIGGGDSPPEAGDFETDAVQYKVRHVFGGARVEPKVTVASNGSGA